MGYESNGDNIVLNLFCPNASKGHKWRKFNYWDATEGFAQKIEIQGQSAPILFGTIRSQ